MAANDAFSTKVKGGVGEKLPHDSGHLHVSGRAFYIDDLPEPRGLLHIAIGTSNKAHAHISKLDLSAVLSSPGVVAVLTAEDIPGKNNFGPVLEDDPIFAPGLVQYVGQSIFAVAAETFTQARRAAKRAVVDYDELEPILDIDDAVKANSFVLPSEHIKRGDSKQAITKAKHRLKGRVHLGGHICTIRI